MPFLRETTSVLEGLVDEQKAITPTVPQSIAPREDAEGPTFGELYTASFQEENLITNALIGLTRPDEKVDEYNAFDQDLGGYEEHWEEFVDSDSPQETQWIKHRLDVGRENRKTIEEAGGWGTASLMAAGILDPTVLVPVGGLAYKGARTGGIAAEAAAIVGVTEVGREIVMQNAQPHRTMEESAMNVAGATILSGILGGAVGYLSRGKLDRLADELDTIRDVERTPDPTQMEFEIQMQAPELDELVGEAAIKKVGFTPEARGRTSESSVVRQVTEAMIDTSFYKWANDAWVATKQSVETRIRTHDRHIAQSLSDLKGQWKNYVKRVPKADREVKTYPEFKKRVAAAMRRGDEDTIPEIKATAKSFRDNVFDRLYNIAIERGIFDDLVSETMEQTNIQSYLMRSYDKTLISKEREQFTTILERYFADSNPDIDANTARLIAEDTVHTIMGESVSRTGRLRESPSSPLHERVLTIPDEMIERYLVDDIEHIGMEYSNEMARNIEFISSFGRVDMEDQLKMIEEEYQELIRVRPSEADSLRKKMQKDIELVKRLRDRVLGRIDTGLDRNGTTSRTLKALRQVQYMAKLGGVWFTSWADVARPMMVHGVGKTLGTSLKLMSSKTLRSMTKDEMSKMSIGLDHVLNSRLLKYGELFDDVRGRNKFERGMTQAENVFSKASIMQYHNDTLKRLSGVMTADRIIDVAKKLKAGKNIRNKDKRFMAMLGIDQDMAIRIADQMDALTAAGRTTKDGKLWLTNLDYWDDLDAKTFLINATNKHSEMIINTPTAGNQPLFMDNAWAKVIAQFKSFLFASHNQTLISGLQSRDASFYTGSAALIGMGYVISMIKEHAAGRDADDVTIADAIDRSGILSVLWEVNNISDKWSGGRLSINAMVGGTGAKRFASRNKLQAILGPTAGGLEDVLSFYEVLSGREASGADISKIRRMLPYQNLFWLRGIFDEVEMGVANTLGVKKPKELPGMSQYENLFGVVPAVKSLGDQL